jgi:hypothetical protein
MASELSLYLYNIADVKSNWTGEKLKYFYKINNCYYYLNYVCCFYHLGCSHLKQPLLPNQAFRDWPFSMHHAVFSANYELNICGCSTLFSVLERLTQLAVSYFFIRCIFSGSKLQKQYDSNAPTRSKCEFQNTVYKIALPNPKLFTGTITNVVVTVYY